MSTSWVWTKERELLFIWVKYEWNGQPRWRQTVNSRSFRYVSYRQNLLRENPWYPDNRSLLEAMYLHRTPCAYSQNAKLLRLLFDLFTFFLDPPGTPSMFLHMSHYIYYQFRYFRTWRWCLCLMYIAFLDRNPKCVRHTHTEMVWRAHWSDAWMVLEWNQVHLITASVKCWCVPTYSSPRILHNNKCCSLLELSPKFIAPYYRWILFNTSSRAHRR